MQISQNMAIHHSNRQVVRHPRVDHLHRIPMDHHLQTMVNHHRIPMRYNRVPMDHLLVMAHLLLGTSLPFPVPMGIRRH